MDYALTEEKIQEIMDVYEVNSDNEEEVEVFKGIIARFECMANFLLNTPEMNGHLSDWDIVLKNAAYENVIEDSIDEYLNTAEDYTGQISTLISAKIVSERIAYTYTVTNLNILKKVREKMVEEEYPELNEPEFKHLVKSNNPDFLK